MSDATYRIKARLDGNKKPLLIVNFQVEYEVVLDADRFNNLHSTVVQYSDGVKGEKLTADEFRLWDDELKRIANLRNQLAELDPYYLNELELKPSSIPRGLLHQILTTYEENTKSVINIFSSGNYPNFALNLNWGTLTYSYPIPISEIKQFPQAMAAVSAKTQQCIDEKKDWDNTKDALWETATTTVGVGKVTVDIIKCVVGLAKGAKDPIKILDTASACVSVVTDLTALIDAIEKEKAEKEAQERERHQQEVEDKIREHLRCADVEAGIKKSRDMDNDIREMNTA